MATRIGLLHDRITKEIIGAFFSVHNELGHGFLESVYARAMEIALRELGLHVECERRITVFFRGRVVGAYVADQVVEQLVILEFKAARAIDPSHEAQCLNLLKATPYEVALVLNFGHKAEFKRLVMGNRGKRAIPPPESPAPISRAILDPPPS